MLIEGGEKVRKVAILVLTLSLLMVISATGSVIADSSNGQKVVVEVTSTKISYSALAPTPNPYPAPPIRERYFTSGHILVSDGQQVPAEYNTMQVRQASAYYTVVLDIGGKSYTGVSCNIYDAEYNSKTMRNNVHYDVIWFIGALGDVSNGFSGNIEATLFDFNPNTGYYSLLTLHGVLQGFGDFEEQTIMISDSVIRTDPVWNGYCIKG